MKIFARVVIAVAVVLLAVSIGLQITAAVTHTSGMPGSLTAPATALGLISFSLAAVALVLKKRAGPAPDAHSSDNGT